MKILFCAGLFLLQLQMTAQSPYLSVMLKMDSAASEHREYMIEMKFCEPLKLSAKGNWFSQDTSAIDFSSLKSADISCAGYFDNGLPEMITGEQRIQKINQFEFGNQVFAWEKILVFKISDASSRNWNPEMYIVMPVKYKSFRTSVQLLNVVFQSGKVIFINEPDVSPEGESRIIISSILKGVKGTAKKDFSLKEIL